MQNLLRETIEELKENGKSESDVLWVGRGYDTIYVKPYKTTWEDFKKKANFEYDNGYGGNEIPMDLIDGYAKKHNSAKECGSEYIYQSDEAQIDALELVADIFDLYANNE